MSVLSFPRIYFQGYMEWDPCTFNNNDWQEFPTYDGVNAALNWPFLATQGITPQNFYSTLRPWAIALQPDCVDQPIGSRLPAEWNMFGSHSASFVQLPAKKLTTTITSGALGATQPVTSDALIGKPVALLGNQGSNARLVDTNPASFWSSQIYFGSVKFGDGDCVISGPRNFRMHSRWLNLSRIYNANSALTQPAASVACCFQTCVPYAEVNWPTAHSPLATALKNAASTSPALGIMVRFTAYVNVYFKNGILNDITTQPRNYKDLANALAAAWNEFNSTGKTDLFFSNPCYSHIVGTLGVWDTGEVASAPVGRFLSAANAVTPLQTNTYANAAPTAAKFSGHAMVSLAPTDTPPPSVTLGPAVVNVDATNQLISIDLNSTMPELGTVGDWPSDLEKANFGALDLGVVSGGTFTSLTQIQYNQYARGSYAANAGIIDIPFSQCPSNVASLLANGTIAIQVQQTSGAVTALQEMPLSAQTDSRGIYLDQKSSAEFDLTVYNLGAPTANTNVLIAQYDQGLGLVGTQATPLVTFTNGQQSTVTSGGITSNVTVVTSNANGVATVGIASASPGFAVLAFFPYTGTTVPTPPAALLGPPAPVSGSITYAFYTTVRVLPFDDAVPQQFVDLWNATQNQTAAWQFIYNNILYLYDMIFNVMLEFVNLGNQSAVQGAIGAIWQLTSAEYAKENTMAMPITRDMSEGKRRALRLWIYLVANNFNVPNFNVDSIPAGWSPS